MAAEGREPRLRRETLRDLTPGDDEARAVRGGDVLSVDVACPVPTVGSIRTDRTTTTISGPDCGPGRWKVDWRILVEHEVFEDGTVQIRSLSVENSEPEATKRGRTSD